MHETNPVAGMADMSKFKSHEEYDHWRSQQALKRQGAKDLAKLDAERPVYSGSMFRGFGIWRLAFLAVLGSACIVFLFSPPGRVCLGKIITWIGR